MSSKIDERVVGLKFDGNQFQKGVAETSGALAKLKNALNFGNSAKGLKDVAAAAGNNTALEGLANGIQGIMGKFGALSVVGITALANIANRAVDAGIQLAKSLTVDPIKAGLGEYELKMGSIQTILSNTARYGTQLPEVTARLDELNTYADKTIYNFGDMTKNIGLFTNAGIRIEDATSMIKGFSNEAASSGTNAQGAASAAYQLSQALSAGTIRLMDWRSLQNVGMGNKNMQNGLIEIADAMGMLTEDTILAEDVQKNFNGSLEKNWLSADVMSNYLKIMAGDMTAAEQASLGLTDAQIAGFAKQQKMSEDAATKVRTYTQLVGTMQESVGSGWAQTFDILIGDFNQATELWTAVNNELGGMVGKASDARNELLQMFVDIGGRDVLIEAFANIWKAFKQYMMPITSAWKEIFPPIQAGNLLAMAKAFRDFTDSLRPSGEQMAQIKRIFQGVFAVIDIGRMIFVEVIKLFGRLFGAATEGAGGLLEFAANAGDFAVKVRDAIKSGEGLGKVFQFLGDVLQKPIDFLRWLGGLTLDILNIDNWAKAWNNVAEAFRKIGEFFAPAVQWLGEFFGQAKEVISEFFKTMDFNVLIGLLNLGALGGIGLGLKKAFDIFRNGGIMALIFGKKNDDGGGLKDKIKEIFGSITDTFKEMQATLKSAQLIGIAIAIGIMAASVALLATVDTPKLFIVLGAMTVMFGQLSAMLLAIDKLTKSVTAPKLIAVGIALGLLAGSMLILSTAILILSTMSWEELTRGLVGVGGGLALFLGFIKKFDKDIPKIAALGGAMILMSTSLVILAAAMKIMGSMSWDEIGRGFVVLGGGLAALALGAKLIQQSAAGAASMILVAIAVTLLSGAFKVFSTMSWDDIGRSMVVMVGAVAALVGAVAILSSLPMAPVGAATMIAMAVAITILTGAMKIFASFSWEEIGKSLVMLAGSLAILAGAMALMGIPLVALGGLALFVVSAGLMMLAPALALLGTMSWDAIGRGLTMLGASLAILAVGGLLLIPASVGFLALGAAVMLLGAGAFLAGTGMMMFATGLLAIAGAGAVGAEALKMAVMTIIGLIPMALAAFAQGIIDFALVIAGGTVEFTAAMVTLITSLMNAINTTAPLVIDTIWNLIVMLVNKVVAGVPMFVDAGMKLITGILNGIANNIYRLTTAATNVIVRFVTALGDNGHRIVTAAGNAVLKFVNGLGDYVRDNSWRFVSAGSKLFRAVVDGISMAISQGGADIAYAGSRIGNALLEGAKNALGINSPSKEFRDKIMPSVFEGITKGNKLHLNKAEAAGKSIGTALLTSTSKALTKASSKVAAPLELTPKITPVVDLSNINKGVSTVKGAFGSIDRSLFTGKIDVSKGVANAKYVQTAVTPTLDDKNYADDAQIFNGSGVTFIQNNNSPKALPPAEIYRKTKNQLSLIKKGVPAPHVKRN